MPFLRVFVLVALLGLLPAGCIGVSTVVTGGPPPPPSPAPSPVQAPAQASSSPAAAQASASPMPASPVPGASPAPTAGPASATAPAGAAPAAGAGVIVLVRSGGFAGRTDRWTLSGDGRVTTAQGTAQAASSSQVAALLSDIQSLGFFKLSDRYGALSQCRDCYNYEMTVTAGGQTKTVSWVGEATDTPPALAQILSTFNALIAAKQ